jgi:hypothetical protein
MAQATFYDGLTGKTIYREETSAEIAERENSQKLSANKVKSDADAQTAKATARQAVLDRLGITADEAALLLG